MVGGSTSPIRSAFANTSEKSTQLTQKDLYGNILSVGVVNNMYGLYNKLICEGEIKNDWTELHSNA